MLVGLGLRAIYQAARQGADGPPHLHHHGRLVHLHPGVPAHVHIGRWTLARRPLLVGAVHGLAGSGALTALVLATLPSTAARLTYMALFGLGSTVGMAALSGMLGWPLGRLAHHPILARGVSLAVGCVSTALGVVVGLSAGRPSALTDCHRRALSPSYASSVTQSCMIPASRMERDGGTHPDRRRRPRHR